MRVWLLALMIALLPLRGWVGDAMALGGGSPATSAHGNTALPPCHGHAVGDSDRLEAVSAHAAAASMVTGGHPDDVSDHAGCNSCDICHGIAMGVGAPVRGDVRPPSARPAWAGVHFASAVLPGLHKPPIS